MAYFNGTAYHEHYEKELKDFTPLDWLVTIAFFGIILAAVVMGFLGKWGLLVLLAGIDIIMMDVMVRVIMHAKNKILLGFDIGALFVIAAGIILITGHTEWIIYYGFGVAGLVWFAVGIICLTIGIRKIRKIKEYTQIVTADCEVVDVRRTNLFRFDDVNSSYYNSANANTLYKPGFHYFVNGTEYFTESTVYYGNGNTGYTEGSRVELRVNPNDPTDILPKNENASIEMIMGISSIVIFVFWVGILAMMLVLGIF